MDGGEVAVRYESVQAVSIVEGGEGSEWADWLSWFPEHLMVWVGNYCMNYCVLGLG
jgi:hypothetical protein